MLFNKIHQRSEILFVDHSEFNLFNNHLESVSYAYIVKCN